MRQNSFNIVQAAIVLLCVMVIVAIILPMLGSVRGRGSGKMQNSTQLRGIHQGLVTYANSNKNYFPGLNELGEDDRISVQERFQILMEDGYISPFYAISPLETEMIQEWEEPYDPYENKLTVTKDNYSYAMLQIPEEGGRRDEWKQTLNSQAIVLSDRNTGTRAKPASIHVQAGDPWQGSVLWNDNHVAFKDTDEYETKYGEGEINEADRLFDIVGTDDALMIYAGN